MLHQCQHNIKISVLTLTHNREEHLINLLEGLSESTRLPDEVIVLRMNEPVRKLSSYPFRVSQTTNFGHECLPLAQSRNLAAVKASGDLLIFLDVDCIPAPECLTEYQIAYETCPQSTFMGAVYYLTKSLPNHWQFSDLHAALPNKNRDPTGLLDLQIEENYDWFWTLSFAIASNMFKQLGGFCEDYVGYGAEDTDFARIMEKQRIELRWVPSAKAYHQYHDSQVPPYVHLKSIVRNAQIYRRRWGKWPMQKWLKAFAEEGLIDWQPNELHIRLL